MDPSGQESKTRLANFDVLRGVFIVLALQQHFAFYLNAWYIDFVRFSNFGSTRYSIHQPHYGTTILPLDDVTAWMAWAGTPWISQIYLSLAAFNLAARNQSELREVLSRKLRLFAAIFLFFAAENMIVAPSIGEALSVYPLLVWMLILAILAIVHARFGLKGILVLWLANEALRFALPFDAWARSFETAMRGVTARGFEFDARPDLFLGAGCLGFMLGALHYRTNHRWRHEYVFGIGAVLIALYAVFGPPFYINRMNILETEHLLAGNAWGTLGIWGSVALAMSGALMLEARGLRLQLPVLSWVGRHSLLVFGLHRIIFVHFLGPLREFAGARLGVPMRNNTLEIYVAIALSIGISFAVGRLGLLRLLDAQAPRTQPPEGPVSGEDPGSEGASPPSGSVP